jgi:hypothetical protein
MSRLKNLVMFKFLLSFLSYTIEVFQVISSNVSLKSHSTLLNKALFYCGGFFFFLTIKRLKLIYDGVAISSETYKIKHRHPIKHKPSE